MSALIEFEALNNADWRDGFLIQTGDPLAALDLTGWTLVMDVRRSSDERALILQLTQTNGRLITTNQGYLTINVPVSEMKLLPAGHYVHDCIGKHPDGSVQRLFEGTLILVDGVTEVIL